MTRRRIFLIFLPAFLLLAAAAFMAWLLQSESGARFAWQQASTQIPGLVSTTQVRGSLDRGLVITGFEYLDESARVQSREIQIELKFDLFPPAVEIPRLKIQKLQIDLLSKPEQDAGSSPKEVLQALSLPLRLRIDDLQIDELSVFSEQGEELFQASKLRLAAVWQDGIQVSGARLRTLDADWTLSGELDFTPPFALKSAVVLEMETTLEDGLVLPLQIQGDFKGNLDQLTTRLTLRNPQLQVEGELLNLLDEPGWQLSMSSKELIWPPASNPGDAAVTENTLLHFSDLLFSTQGQLEHYDFELDTKLNGGPLAGLPSWLNSRLSGTGNSTALEIDSFTIRGAELDVSAKGQLTWAEGLVVDLNTQIHWLHPESWMEGWPDANPVQGKLGLNITPERVEFRDLILQIEGLETILQGEGEYDLAQGIVAGKVEWQSVAWPLGASNVEWSSESGQFVISGQPRDWQAEGRLQLLVSGFPSGQVQLNLTGSDEELQAVIEQGNILGGQFAGQAGYRWVAPASWSADLTANNIDITPLVPDYPGVVSGSVLARGDVEEDTLQLDLRQVQGRLRGLDLSAQGKLAIQGSNITAEKLRIRSGSGKLTLDGNLAQTEGLEFSADIANLGDFLPDGSGTLTADGRVSLNSATPKLDIRIEGNHLVWGENTISSIRSLPGQNDSLTLQVDDAFLGGRQVENFQLSLAGSQPLERIRLQARIDGTDVETEWMGKVIDWSDPITSGWQGQIQSLQLSANDQGFLKLDQAVPLKLSSQAASLDQACLRGPQNGQLCLQGDWTEQGSINLSSEFKGISLDVVRLFTGMDWAFTHRLDGQVQWQKSHEKQASAQARISLSEGELLFDQESVNFKTGPGVFEFLISEGNLHSGKLQIPVIGSGAINLDFSIPRIADGANAELIAHLVLGLKDISPLQLLIPQFEAVNGELSADIRVGGTVQDPQFTGHTTLVRGYLEDHATGLVISNIQLAGAVYQYDHTELNGSFQVGEGRGRIKADLRFEDFLNPDIRVELKGENLLLVNVPDLNVLANPDLAVRWNSGLLELNGRVAVPSAQLSPRYLPTSSATESEDLVIVSSQLAAELPPEAPAKPIRIKGEVEVALGKDVKVTLDKAIASITGKANFIWNNALIPTGDGAYFLSGEIYTYGQLLSISEGRVSFPKSPADNPNLNIKAEREIYGNTQVKKAGVLISGTLKRPSLETYTYPLTTKERALTLLVTGNDFDYEQGVGGVEVGMYVAPKLFISYGIGLFEDQSVISARYDLGSGFGIKATSGQRATGVDLSYTIEKE